MTNGMMNIRLMMVVMTIGMTKIGNWCLKPLTNKEFNGIIALYQRAKHNTGF